MNLYAICVGAGAGLGLYALARSAKPKEVDRSIDAGLILLALALVGARAAYGFLHTEYFSAHLTEILTFWLGGLSWVGCAAGLLAGVPIIQWMFGYPPADAWRLTVILAVPLAALTWLGCWAASLGYGPSFPQASLIAWPTADETGRILPRFPLQPVCALLLIAALGLLEYLKTRLPWVRKKFTALSLFFLSLDMLLFALLRADPVRDVFSLKVDSWAAGLLLLLSLAVLVVLPEPDSGKSRPPVS